MLHLNIRIPVPNQAGLEKLLQQECGDFSSYSSSSTSFSGRELVLRARPWMAVLRYNNKSDTEKFSCVGTLITERELF